MKIKKKRSRDLVKRLIILSPSVTGADKAIVESFGFKTVAEKIAFLKGMFDIEVIGHQNDKNDETTYYAMLNTIIQE